MSDCPDCVKKKKSIEAHYDVSDVDEDSRVTFYITDDVVVSDEFYLIGAPMVPSSPSLRHSLSTMSMKEFIKFGGKKLKHNKPPK